MAGEDRKPLFTSDQRLFGFQVDGTVETYLRWTEGEVPSSLLLYDTGLGKTPTSLASLALAFEDDLIDVALVIAQANKVSDWVKVDFPKFTPGIDYVAYTGVPAKRRKVLDQGHEVLVTTYDTAKADICGFEKKKRTEDRFLLEYLRGKRVALVFDEFSVLGNRGSQRYMAFEHLFRELRRKVPRTYALGLTATSVETSPANHFNACRLLAPSLSSTVEQFEREHVDSYDIFGNPKDWTALTPEETPPGVIPLSRRYASITSRKRKTDADVIDQFPAKVENPTTMVDLDREHRRLYDEVEEIYADPDLDEQTARQGWGILRLLAGHPQALLGSRGEHAQRLVESVGVDHLRSLKAAKIEAMLEWQSLFSGQQTVIFTFFGQTVLPMIHQALVAAGHEVSLNHGQMSRSEQFASRERFRAGDTGIFLSSDAGAKGLNLGMGSGLLHYEAPGTWATFEQRSNRIHRIDSVHPSVTIDHLVARHTVEEHLVTKMLDRSEMSQKIMDDDYVEGIDPSDGFVSAKDRIAAWRETRLGVRPGAA